MWTLIVQVVEHRPRRIVAVVAIITENVRCYSAMNRRPTNENRYVHQPMTLCGNRRCACHNGQCGP